MNKKTLLFLWAFLSYATFAVSVPWYFVYGSEVLRTLGRFSIVSCAICVITFAIKAIKADKQAIKKLLQEKVSLTTLKKIILYVIGKISFLFFESIRKGEINKILLISCGIITLIVSIPFVIIIVVTITLWIGNMIYYIINLI